MRCRVYCNFVVEADSVGDVIQFLAEDGDFVEKHLIVEETDAIKARLLRDPATEEDIYADIRK